MNIDYIIYHIYKHFNRKKALNFLFEALNYDIKKVADKYYNEIHIVKDEMDALPNLKIFNDLKSQKQYIIEALNERIKIDADYLLSKYIKEIPILIITLSPEKIIKNKDVKKIFENLSVELFHKDNILFITLNELDKIISKIRRIIYDNNLDFEIPEKVKVLSNNKYDFFDDNKFYIKYFILDENKE